MLWYIKNFLNKRRIFFNLDVQDSNVWFFFDSDQFPKGKRRRSTMFTSIPGWA